MPEKKLMRSSKKQEWQGEGYGKLDARQKFERAGKDLKLLQRRLLESRRKEGPQEKETAELEAKRTKLMAVDFLERTKKHKDELKAIEDKLAAQRKKHEDTVAISTELSELLKKRKESLRHLELAFLKEGQEHYQAKIDEITVKYHATQEEIQGMRREATEIKHKLQEFHSRRVKLEKEAALEA